MPLTDAEIEKVARRAAALVWEHQLKNLIKDPVTTTSAGSLLSATFRDAHRAYEDLADEEPAPGG